MAIVPERATPVDHRESSKALSLQHPTCPFDLGELVLQLTIREPVEILEPKLLERRP